MNRVQLALLLGVHQDTISDYSRQGMPVTSAGGHGVESAYDAVKCLDWWRERQGKNAKEAAQTRAFTAQAELNEQKLARERSELVSRSQVIAEGQQYTKAWQAKIRALPRALVLAGVISREEEPAVMVQCMELLRDISNWKTVADLVLAIESANAA